MAELIFTPAGAGVGTNSMFTVANRTALAALGTATFAVEDGALARVLSDNSFWRYNAASTAAADFTGTVSIAAGAVTAAQIVLVPTGAAAGRWIRADKAFTLRIPFVFGTADAALMHTVPVGFAWRMTGMPYWDITTGLVGDAATRIGWSSSNLAGDFTVKGDILGSAGGDSIATLGAGAAIVTPGTIGDAWSDADTANTSLAVVAGLMPVAGSTIRYDIIVAGTGLTAGAGMLCIPVSLEQVAMVS